MRPSGARPNPLQADMMTHALKHMGEENGIEPISEGQFQVGESRPSSVVFPVFQNLYLLPLHL